MKKNNWLNHCSKNFHSQNGEDGILAQILETLPTNDQWCVEFGAWDGKHLSNTFHLIETKEYHAVLIESNPIKFQDLQTLQKSYPRIVPMNQLVWINGDNKLDNLLQRTDIPKDFDLLSIDIDGNDIHIWEHCTVYQPKVVCIEFNPSIPTELSFAQPIDPTLQRGCSLMALYELGKKKGYELVATTMTNAIFVAADYFPLFEIADNSPYQLRAENSKVSYIFSGYDGHVHLLGARKVVWHGVRLYEEELQFIPRPLRRYPLDMNKLQQWGLTLLKGFRAVKNFARREA